MAGAKSSNLPDLITWSAASAGFVGAEFLPCAFEECHTGHESICAFHTYAAFGEFRSGLHELTGLAEVVDYEIGHVGAVVALGAHEGVVYVDSVVHNYHVAEFLHEVEVVPCAEEIGLAYVLGDFGLISVAGGILEQKVAAADVAVCSAVVAVALGNGVGTVGKYVDTAFIAHEVGALVGVKVVVDCAEVGYPVVEYVGEAFEVAGLAPEVGLGELILRVEVEARCRCERHHPESHIFDYFFHCVSFLN